MSFRMVHLNKLLRTLYASNSERISILRTDIRREIGKQADLSDKDGGDFYGPFWADAKKHVAGKLDLSAATAQRIKDNKKSRGRLYPLLQDGFLRWWEERRRQRNVAFTIIEEGVKARYEVPELGTIKIENTLAFTVGDHSHRIVHPYFYESPLLSDEAARLGLWVMSKKIAHYGIADLRVLDIIRGRTVSIIETPLQGNEEALLTEKYKHLLEQWDELRKKYN